MDNKKKGEPGIFIRTTAEKKAALLSHSKRLNVSQRRLFDIFIDGLDKIERVETRVYKVSK